MEPVPFTSRFDEESRTLLLSGEIELRFIDHLSQTLRVLSSVDLRVDLSDVTFLPSAAVVVLIRAQLEAPSLGGMVHLRSATGSIAARIFRVTAVPFETIPAERPAEEGPSSLDAG